MKRTLGDMEFRLLLVLSLSLSLSLARDLPMSLKLAGWLTIVCSDCEKLNTVLPNNGTKLN